MNGSIIAKSEVVFKNPFTEWSSVDNSSSADFACLMIKYHAWIGFRREVLSGLVNWFTQLVFGVLKRAMIVRNFDENSV